MRHRAITKAALLAVLKDLVADTDVEILGRYSPDVNEAIYITGMPGEMSFRHGPSSGRRSYADDFTIQGVVYAGAPGQSAMADFGATDAVDLDIPSAEYRCGEIAEEILNALAELNTVTPIHTAVFESGLGQLLSIGPGTIEGPNIEPHQDGEGAVAVIEFGIDCRFQTT